MRQRKRIGGALRYERRDLIAGLLECRSDMLSERHYLGGVAALRRAHQIDRHGSYGPFGQQHLNFTTGDFRAE